MVVAGEFLDYITRYKVTSHVGIDDVADRFNFLFTVIIILLCTTILTIKQYLLKPISCYLANDPGGVNLLEFVEYYCWVEGTIPQESNVRLPENEDEWAALENKKILYYQWIPFLLGIQCILFYLPHLIWKIMCYNRAGTDLHQLVANASDAMHADLEQREKLVLQVSRTMERLLFQPAPVDDYCASKSSSLQQRCRKLLSCLCFGRRAGNQLVLGYLVLKILYLSNSFGQLVMFQQFLGTNVHRNQSSLFGWQVAGNMVQGRDWRSTLLFPRVTVCYTRVRHMGSTNSVTAQCVLPVNMLTEKMYVFLWFWIALTSVVTAFSMMRWLMQLGYHQNHRNFIKKHLRLGQVFPFMDDSNNVVQERKKGKTCILVDHFITQFLRLDGIFLLRIMSINVGDVVTSDILCQLWWAFQRRRMGDIHGSVFRNKWEHQAIPLERSARGAGDFQPEAPPRTPNIPLPDPPTMATLSFKRPTALESSMEAPKDVVQGSINVTDRSTPQPHLCSTLPRRRYSSTTPAATQPI